MSTLVCRLAVQCIYTPSALLFAKLCTRQSSENLKLQAGRARLLKLNAQQGQVGDMYFKHVTRASKIVASSFCTGF